MEKQNKNYISITIKTIKEITHIKDTRTIVKYLKILIVNNVIQISNKSIDSKISINDSLLIEVNSTWVEPEHYTIMSEELFINTIGKIKPLGWSLLCMLSKLHNYNYGTLDPEHNLFYTGYSCPSEEILMHYLSIASKTTLHEYINLLENERLIFVVRTNRVDTFENQSGDYEYKRVNNKYIVNSRIPDKKYFLKLLKKKYDKIIKEKLKNG